ncbi:MAG TPA: M23 family metallopeptidase, partial [Clostridia bacterium]|nr:M23 family metallopeptidase [Clostridia bacterium]
FYMLGIQNFRYGKRIFIRLGRFLMKPVRYTFTLARVFVLGVDRVFFKSLHALHEEFVYFHKEIKSSGRYLRHAFKESPLSSFAILSHYTKKAFKKHKDMFRTVLNLGIPLVALLVLWATLMHWNSVTYSLQLTYNGAEIGYIQNESVYIEAQALVNEQLETVAKARMAAGESIEKSIVEKEQFEKPKYELALVQLNELSDKATLSDSLIDNSAEQLTTACGIFIDGDFLGAVKNETDATGVFENILAPYQTDDPTTNAAFVEDVRFTQGLYSVKTKMMDASELKDKLSTKKAEAVYHTVKDGETIWSIATSNGLSESALLQLNPNQGQLIKTGDRLKVSNEVNFIRVKLIKTEVRTVEVAFETIKTSNPKLFKGDTRIVRKGVPGKETVTELVTYIDNTRVSAQEIGRNRLSEPIAQKTDVGTKSTKVSGSSGSYNVKVSNVGFVWPVPGYYNKVSSPFGYRNRGFHSGVDISGPGINGKVIVAAKDGVVESTGTGNSGLGNRIVINHGGGIKTRYGHCLSGSISVKAGQRVSAGQAIARVGSTGNSTGPHLHFEVLVNGSAVNPLPYIR